MRTEDFQELIWEKAHELYRDMPWRQDTRPYYVLVSEIMLQQTQVERVVSKFESFIATFPDVQRLAAAPLSAVLQLWTGLGYNRRAKFLHEAAKKIASDFGGVFPQTREALMSLPGVGANTAGAILAYSFNQPVVYVETNVRTVYFYHFFDESEETVRDSEIQELLEKTLDREHPREWYWVLMDYGSHLKRNGVKLNAKSHHYKKQSALKGSLRETRGAIVKVLAEGELSVAELRARTHDDVRFEKALAGLERDGLVMHRDGAVYLSD